MNLQWLKYSIGTLQIILLSQKYTAEPVVVAVCNITRSAAQTQPATADVSSYHSTVTNVTEYLMAIVLIQRTLTPAFDFVFSHRNYRNFPTYKVVSL